MMRLIDVASLEVVKALKGSKMTRIREIFRKKAPRLIVIVEDYFKNKYVGYVTRHDVIQITSSKSNKLVDDFLHDKPILTPELSIQEAISILRESGRYALPLVESLETKKVLGIFSYRGLLRALKASGFSPKAKAAADVMTTENLPLIPQQSPITKAWSQLVYRERQGLVVIRDEKTPKPVGILTPLDLIQSGKWYFRRESEHGVTTPARVRTVMKRGAIVAYPDTPVDIIADYIINHDFSLIPVVDKDGNVIGIVTQEDVVRAYIEGIKPGRVPVPAALPPLRAEAQEALTFRSSTSIMQQVLVSAKIVAPSGLRAIDIARPELPAVRLTDTIERARNIMLREKVNSLLVVDEEGRIVGSLSTRNFLYAIGIKGPLWKRRPYEKSFINEIMNQNVLLVREETPVEDVAKEMLNTESEVAIVTDEKGLLKGIITKEELADALARLRGEMKIENVMPPLKLGVVHPHHSLAHAVKRMKAYYLDALAVAVGGIAEGVVSENRLPFIPLEDSKTGLRTRRLLWVRKLEKGGRKMGRYIKITPLLVEDVMVPTRDVVETDETLENAINIMKKLNIDGLPVINKNGKVIGVVCKHDYIRELARSSKLTGKIKTKVREARLSE